MEIGESLGEKLTFLRKKKGWTQGELAEKSGVHHSLISLYEANKQIPHDKNLQKIAEALSVDTKELLESKEMQKEFTKEYPSVQNYIDFYSRRFIYVPILTKVHVGSPNEIPENLVIGGIDLPTSIAKGADYALKISGMWMSMKEKGIEENDIVLVRIQKYAENGQIVILRIDNEEYRIKLFTLIEGQAWVDSENSLPIPLIDKFKIVGIITGLVKKFK